MAGSLKKIDEEIVTSAVASVSLLGIDSTYDVYMVRLNNVGVDTDNMDIYVRYTVSGTAQTGSYARANKRLDTNAFTNDNSTSANQAIIFEALGTDGTIDETGNAILYLFNFNNASEYSFCTLEAVNQTITRLKGFQGGFTRTNAEVNDGLYFFVESSNNIASGTFTLYGLKK